MAISNLHTHTLYCDGKNTIEENILKAISLGFVSIGFSPHSYTPFDLNYCMSEDDTAKYLIEIDLMREKYRDEIEVYIGIEADYYSNLCPKTDILMNLDYRIGGVHYVLDKPGNYYPIDTGEDDFLKALKNCADGDIKKLASIYYSSLIDMINTQKPDIVAHIDLIKKYNRDNKYFDDTENWHLEMVDKVLESISENNAILELNTGGMFRGYCDSPYPSDLILKRALSMEIPIIINSDSHSVDGMNYYYDESAKLLKKIGFRSVKILKDNIFQDYNLA